MRVFLGARFEECSHVALRLRRSRGGVSALGRADDITARPRALHRAGPRLVRRARTELTERDRARVSILKGHRMARKYSRGASKDVERAMRKRKRGTLKRGKGGRGGRVKSRKQAIAIGLSEARKKGKKVPKRRAKR